MKHRVRPARQRKQRTLQFLFQLDSATRALNDPDAIMAVTARLLGEQLGVNRCAYAEVEADADHFVITGDYNRDTFSIVGRYSMADFGVTALRLMRANKPYVVADVATDPRVGTDLSVYQHTAIAAVICVPLHKDGRFVAAMAVHQTTPRHWTPEEVELVLLVVNRCWESIERARVDRGLRDSQARLSLAQRAGGVGVFEWLIPENRNIWSPELEALYGIPEGSFEGSFDDWRKRVVPEDGDRVAAGVERCLAARQTEYAYEFRAMMPDGAHRWFAGQARFLYGPDGQPQRMIGVNVDIDARKQAEAALRESEAQFRRMADTAPAMIWVTDPSGACTFLSRGWYEFTGQNEVTGLGYGWIEAVHPDDRTVSRDIFLAANVRREPFAFDYRLKGADGEYRWAIDAGRPRFADDGAYLGFVGSVIDIHDRKQAEEALRVADRRKDEFLATLAHELRNPLAPIRNALGIMRLAQHDPARLDQARSMIERQVSQMVRLIDDLLDVSRITRGTLELRPERVDLATVLHSAVETVGPLIQAAGQTFTINIPPYALPVQADAIRLAQVFSNLLNNATKYTEPGGAIVLSAEQHAATVVITVKDTGVGIPPSMLESIFEMFSQVDHSLERSRGGLGIGLSIVRRLVEMHGGSITAYSAGQGHGSEFTVRLPLATAAPSDTPSQTPQTALTPGTPSRILVVDDHADVAESLAELLTFTDHEVRTAYDGQAGLEVAATFQPQVALLDIGLPKLNGYDVAQHIRAQPWGQSMTLIALTGWGQDKDRRRSHDAGFDYHLVKPVDPDTLLTLLADLAQLPQPGSRVD